ncbi:MAG: alpha/beta fold hydrolase [Anaerolineaceae bacterium]|nr:alpha/beta fold hydrolase [Anaerolineaceae bacterium]
MKTSVSLVLVLLLLGLAAPGFAQDEAELQAAYEAAAAAEGMYGVTETVVNIDHMGYNIVGTLAMPDGEGPFPIVLLLHGFTGQRHELPVVGTEEFMYGRTARHLGERGYASLRIDFLGSGESDGAWEDTTFSGQIADALVALEYASGLDGVDGERIGIIGLSQGGLVASGTAAAAADQVDTVILWSPVSSPPMSYTILLGMDWISAGLASGGEAVSGTLPWGAEIALRTGFFDEIFTVDPVGELANYGGPVQVVVGTRDDTVWPQPQAGQVYLNYHDGPEQLVVLDGDHIFDVLATGPAVLDEAITWALAWLMLTL